MPIAVTPAPVERPRWSDRVRAWRDRLLASPAFRRRAAAFLPTRPIARRRAAALFDLVAGFVYSQVLLACVRLRVCDRLAEAPQSAEQLAPALGLGLDATRRLLAAAVSLRLVERRGGGRFGLGPLGAPLVGNAAITAMVEHHGALYRDLADPVALLRGEAGAGALAGYWPYAANRETAAAVLPGAASVEAYTRLMAASQPLVASEILDAVPLGDRRCLLDVGGGDGSFLVAAARRASALRLMLFDLPSVADHARARFAAEGLADRASVHAGSFLHDPLPGGADIASLVRVIHDHDDAGAMTILRSVRTALPPGGRLVLAEPMAETRGAEAMGDAYFGFYLLAMGRGRPRSEAALTRLLAAAGFERIRGVATHMPLQTRVLVAETP